MKKQTHILSCTMFTLAFSAALSAQAQAQEASHTPATGLLLEARLAAVNLPGADGLLGGLGGPTRVAIGYRGEGYTIAIGPMIHRGTISAFSSQSINLFGAHIIGTRTFFDTSDKRTEFYGLGDLSIGAAFSSSEGSSNSSNPMLYGVNLGVGARHFITSNLSLGVEIGEGFLFAPDKDVDISTLTTWGALVAQVVI